MGSQLESVVARLEAVTSRLEHLELSAGGRAGASGGGGSGGAIAASSTATSAAPAAAAGSIAGGGGGDALSAYDALLAASLSPLVDAAAAVGGDVEKVTRHVAAAYRAQRGVIAASALAHQPSSAELQALVAPVADEMVAASALADDRRSPAFQQLKVVAEALGGLSWLAYTGPACGMPAPPQHAGDAWNAAEFYANKLMMQLRGKDEPQMAWLRAFKGLCQALQTYLRQHFPGGLKWNPGGVSAADAAKQVAAGGGGGAGAGAAAAPAPAPAAPARKGPPPPPPPPPVELLLKERPAAAAAPAKSGGGGGGGMSDVFKQLQGGGVTAGLRKVTDAMKAKNQPQRSGVVPAAGNSAAAAPAAPAAPAAAAKGSAPTGAPRTQLELDRKWVVEHHRGDREIVVDQTDPKHTVYVFNCHDCVVQVRGKVNAVSIDGCRKTGVVFDTVIASCELVNCAGVQVQCLGAVPTVSVDKCDGAQVFVPARVAARDFQLVTAKSSEVNVTVVPEDPEAGDAVEHAVPEQFISSFKGGRLVTVAASHSGG